MKVFVYRGFDRAGNRRKGTIEAGDLKEAREKLVTEGIFAESVEAGSGMDASAGKTRSRGSSLDRDKYRAGFYRALSSLLRAGLPMAAALEVLMDEPGAYAGQASLQLMGMRERIKEGSSFSDALTATSPSLSSYESAVLESGEKTGRLPEVMMDIADYLEEMDRTRDLLKTASIYPAIVILIALLVATGVLGFMVPRFAGTLAELGGELPWITRMVMAVGNWFFPVILPLMAVAITGIVSYASSLGRNRERRLAFEKRIATWPLISRGFLLLVTVRFARTSHLLLSGGLSMVETIALAGKATGSLLIADAAREQSDLIRHGKALSVAVQDMPLISRTLGMWIKAGESAGDLPGLFLHAANRYRQLWAQYVQRATTFIEPVLVLLVALFVLVIALAIILPALSINPEMA